MRVRRRTVLTGGGLALIGGALRPARLEARLAAVAAADGAAAAPGDVEAALRAAYPRGRDGRLGRLAALDLEGRQDFTLGFRRMHNQRIRAAALEALSRALSRAGLDDTSLVTVPELLALVQNDPAVNLLSKTWVANQQVTWKTLHEHFHSNADVYLDALDAAGRIGAGTLELSPSLDLPDYTRHEFHLQPGGYVGDPFAGYLYHYGTNSFYIGVIGHNEQDEVHRGTAAAMPTPVDGKVRRILDLGCGIGQLTVALKERFPDAEVWGIDPGAPMLRYAHLRAAQLGSNVQFAQRLGESTGFPDGYFDLVVAYIVHHELPADRSIAVVEEARRIVRPGGVYYPLDMASGGTRATARATYFRWWDHRWNGEPWTLEFHELDLSAALAQRGFAHARATPPLLRGFASRHFIRTDS